MKFFQFVVLGTFFTAAQALAQPGAGPINVQPNGIVDGVYVKTQVPTKQKINFEYVREADVVWSKRVWRTIDLREKMNHNLYYPLDDYDVNGNWIRNSSRWSLWTVLRQGVLDGRLTVYSPYNPLQYTMEDGDQFKYPIVPRDGGNYFTDSVYRENLNYYIAQLGELSDEPYKDINNRDSMNEKNELVYPDREIFFYKSSDIVQYRLKEDYFFDKERGVMDVRIIGIAPIIYVKDDNGFVTGKRELFWLYFPECRYVLNNYYAFNAHNDAQWMSYDDLFQKRRFASTIDKESNAYDRRITTYRVGVEALHEANKISEEIRGIEHDVWSF